MNVYGRTRQEKLSEVVSEMAESVLGTKKCALYVPRLAAGAERQSATPLTTEGCASSNLAPTVGLEPASGDSQDFAESQQNSANSAQFSVLATTPDAADEQKSALPQQNPSTSVHEKCVPSVHQNRDLQDVVEAWPDLSDKVKVHLLKIVKDSR